MKKAYTIDQQIARLKSNGMMFDNEEKAKEILLDVGYYRLGFYSFPYEIKFPRLEHRDHKLKSGTTFKSVYDLYENPIIQHHHANHSGIYAPAWKTIEFMTIGNIITLYDSLKEPAAKDLVANAYGCSKGGISQNRKTELDNEIYNLVCSIQTTEAKKVIAQTSKLEY